MRRAVRALDSRQVVGTVHQCHVGERLGEVAELAPRRRVIFLGQESNVVGEANQSLEEGASFVDASQQREVVHQPECARQEYAFTRG